MTDLSILEEILTAVLNMAVRPPGLRPFARIKYSKELRLTRNADNSISGCITLWGWEYKRRHPRPKVKPKIDTRAVKTDLNEFLKPTYMVSEVYDHDTYAQLIIWRIQ